MSINDDIPQANPNEFNSRLVELRERAERTVAVFEENKGVIIRWFWRVLLAFNLLLGSVVFWTVIVPHLVHSV